MLAELAKLHPQVHEVFAEASEGAGVDLWALSQGGPEEMLNRTEYTQPALLAGHSLGEYTALVAAGALSLRDGAHLVRLRGQLMQDAAPAGTVGGLSEGFTDLRMQFSQFGQHAHGLGTLSGENKGERRFGHAHSLCGKERR